MNLKKLFANKGDKILSTLAAMKTIKSNNNSSNIAQTPTNNPIIIKTENQNLKDPTKKISIKTSIESGLWYLSKWILTIIFIATLMILGGKLMPIISSWILLIVEIFGFPSLLEYWLQNLISVYLLFILLTFIWPWGEIETKLKISKKVLNYLLILIICIAIYAFIFSGTNQANQNQEEIVNDLSNSKTSFFSWIGETFCVIKDPNCLQKQEKTTKAENIIDYEFKIRKPSEVSLSLQDIITYPIIFDYSIKGTKINLEQLNCYYENKNKKNLFHSENLSTKNFNSINEISSNLNVQCLHSLDKLKEHLDENKNEQTVKIIAELNFNVNSQISQDIPIVNYIQMKEKYPISDKNKFLDLINKEVQFMKSFSSTAPTLNVKFVYIDDLIPIISNDDYIQSARIDLIITNSENTFGKIRSGEIKIENIPEFLTLENEQQVQSNLEFSNSKFEQTLRLTEEENFQVDEKIFQTLKLTTDLKFEKTDTFNLNFKFEEEELNQLFSTEIINKQNSTN